MKHIIIFILFSVTTIAQVEYSRGNNKAQYLPNFYLDLASYKSKEAGKTKVDVFIKIPYSNLQFLKNDKGYQSKYSIIVSVYDEDDELKLEKLWNETVTTRMFDQTALRTSYNVSYKSLHIPPGRYKFVCKLEDNESRKHAVYERMINVREYKDDLELSDLILVSEFIQTQQGLKIIPSISNIFTSKDTSISFFYEIYSNAASDAKVSYAINNKDGEPLYVKDYIFSLKEGKNEIRETLDMISFSLGDYQLEVKLLDENNGMIKGSGKAFASNIFGIPQSIRDLDLAIRQMQFIATPEEIENIDTVDNYQLKLDKYLDYWKNLDPSPNTITNETMNEYYRRVSYAEAHFKGSFKGWRSDMGMIYITLGPPDQVTRRPYQLDSKPYEIWDYFNINRRFIFVDKTNFGDYRLLNPAYGEWFRYRP